MNRLNRIRHPSPVLPPPSLQATMCHGSPSTNRYLMINRSCGSSTEQVRRMIVARIRSAFAFILSIFFDSSAIAILISSPALTSFPPDGDPDDFDAPGSARTRIIASRSSLSAISRSSQYRLYSSLVVTVDCTLLSLAGYTGYIAVGLACMENDPEGLRPLAVVPPGLTAQFSEWIPSASADSG